MILTYAINSNGIFKCFSDWTRELVFQKKLLFQNDKGIFYQEEIDQLIEQAKRYKIDDEKAKKKKKKKKK